MYFTSRKVCVCCFFLFSPPQDGKRQLSSADNFFARIPHTLACFLIPNCDDVCLCYRRLVVMRGLDVVHSSPTSSAASHEARQARRMYRGFLEHSPTNKTVSVAADRAGGPRPDRDTNHLGHGATDTKDVTPSYTGVRGRTGGGPAWALAILVNSAIHGVDARKLFIGETPHAHTPR